ncbi:MAG: secondary thiamine-phosphate synthase enzyme YjbQ [Candidatus Thermoplasmatota archaeon]|jgi:secondary thiamine-phosphate synthase enzyme|nr:secondary thiamine-phosphate synthase enzyme YjbQ [Candidatus Thermoplasmatota archaeon]
MGVYCGEINIKTKKETDIVDITDDVQKIVDKSEIKNGVVCIFVPGSTGAVTTAEYEPGLMKDLPDALERVAPKNIYYKHHETWHDDNGHSHVRASLIGPSITVPVIEGKIVHGTWQQIVFIEFDTRPRNRRLVVQVLGE